MSSPANCIDGVGIYPLKQICDERGKVMHMLRRDDAHFQEFGEIYFSTIYPGVVKGWHLHSRMTLNYAVVVGMIKLVLFDDRETSPTRGRIQEVFLGVDNYVLVTVPFGVWNGFKGIGAQTAIVANCATIPHEAGEISRLDPFNNHIPYDWAIQCR
jgi:dTDP-4-dehydrorhamnose 3,5-epimerase